MIELDAETGTLRLLVSDEELKTRQHATADLTASHQGMGRELFAPFRAAVGLAEEGATVFTW
jgi:phosphogluconate dehydratase